MERSGDVGDLTGGKVRTEPVGKNPERSAWLRPGIRLLQSSGGQGRSSRKPRAAMRPASTAAATLSFGAS
jgi:hypothetical protein